MSRTSRAPRANLLTDNVKIHFNIFGASMKHRIKTHICGSKIIAPQNRNTRLKDVQFCGSRFNPNNFNCAIRDGLIFYFSWGWDIMGCLRALQEMRLELRKTMKPPVEIERKKKTALYASARYFRTWRKYTTVWSSNPVSSIAYLQTPSRPREN
jgi:hypothetical protein